MLTKKEKMHVYAYWQRGVKRGVYLKDIEPGHLSTQALLHLIPSALYCKYELLELPENDMKIGHLGRNCELLHTIVDRHRANLKKYETLSM